MGLFDRKKRSIGIEPWREQEDITVVGALARPPTSDDLTPDEVTLVRDIPEYGELLWEEMRLDEIGIMIGRMAE